MKWLSAFESKNTPNTKIKEIWLIAISKKKNVKKFNILKCFGFGCNVNFHTHGSQLMCINTQIEALYYLITYK